MINIFTKILNKLSYFYLFRFKTSNDQISLYDNLIKITLEVSEIPQSKGYYFLNPEIKEFVVDDRDVETFIELFYTTPPRKGKSIGINRSIGNGEVALYWLFKYQNIQNKVINSKNYYNCDLLINDNNIEIKDFDNPSGKIKYGRFASDRVSLKILNIVFGMNTLYSETDLEDNEDKVVNVTNFNGNDLLEVFNKMFWLIESYDIYNKDYIIYEKIQMLLKLLNNPINSYEATRRFIIQLITNKLNKKPGNNNFILNVSISGLVSIFYVDFCKLVNISDEDLFNSVEVSQSVICLDLKTLFG